MLPNLRFSAATRAAIQEKQHLKATAAQMTTPSPTVSGHARTSTRPAALAVFALLVAAPVLLAVVMYQADEFDAAELPADHSYRVVAPREHHGGVLPLMARVGEGLLPGPEDFAYDAGERVIYTGCLDGWIRRVRIGDSEESPAVEDWAYVGGRPLGIALGLDGRLLVANADKGLLAVDHDKQVHLLTDQADDLEFKLTDGIDVASDGMVYFTDASYKYNLEQYMLDLFETRPYGRLLSFDPSTNQTKVLLRDLYFANGVALSPDQGSLIFCETLLRRCKRYYIQGEKKGKIDTFIENLHGFPDNIRYDGNRRYWIGLASGKDCSWDLLLKYPILRKLYVLIAKYVHIPNFFKDGGVLEVSLEGEPLTLYTDPGLYLVTAGLKIGKHLYFAMLEKPYIGRLDISQLKKSNQG